MPFDSRTLSRVLAAATMMVVLASTAHAAPVSKCNAAKKKCIGKYVAAVLGCHAKAEAKGVAVDAGCIAKAEAKITGGGKGCFDKNDTATPNDCGTVGDAAVHLGDADALIADVVTAVDPSYPTPTLTKCGAVRKKCVGKEAAGLLACSAKLSKDGIGDSGCAPKVMDKFGGAKGCDVNALAKGSDCLGSTTTAALAARVDAWATTSAVVFDYEGPPCGNGVIDAGEFCDPAAPTRQEAACGTDFACNPTTCNCDCPSTVHFVGDPTSPATNLDLGWTGLVHHSPTLTSGDVTVALSGCAGTTRPCGVCAFDGPIPNAGATELRSRRCTDDTSVRCADDTPCLGGGGTCEYYFGTALPLAAGGITTCVTNQFDGPISGTVNLETGDATTTALLSSRVFTGSAIDTPCPVCAGDATVNDDVQGGTCLGGPRDGLACDANGTVPARPDFGATSLDCPPAPETWIATLPIDLGGATAPVTKLLTAASPTCSYGGGGKCLCDTCNNVAQEPCQSNADCPDPAGPVGPICGGRRCLGGANVGAPCTANSACPAGICARPGEPTRPYSCFDDSTTPGIYNCIDGDGDGQGECGDGPIMTVCSSPHAQRGCVSDEECTPGTCETVQRPCFLTGDGAMNPGTGTLVATGAADAPVHDTASPIHGSVFCIGPTGSPAVNNVTGLPGPGRLTLQGTATGRP